MLFFFESFLNFIFVSQSKILISSKFLYKSKSITPFTFPPQKKVFTLSVICSGNGISSLLSRILILLIFKCSTWLFKYSTSVSSTPRKLIPKGSFILSLDGFSFLALNSLNPDGSFLCKYFTNSLLFSSLSLSIAC